MEQQVCWKIIIPWSNETNFQASCLISAWLITRLGPLATIRICYLSWIIECVFSYHATQTTTIIVMKILKGVSMGIISVCAPFYLFEVLIPTDRGMGIAALGLGNILGQATMIALGYVLRQFFPPVLSFHFTRFGEAGLGVVALLLSFLLPELPSTLCRQNDYDKANRTLHRLLGKRDGFHVVKEAVFPFKLRDMFSSFLVGRLTTVIFVQFTSQIIFIIFNAEFLSYVCALCRLNDRGCMIANITQYSLMFVCAFFPTHTLKMARRKDYLAVGLFLLTALFTAMACLSYLFGNASTPSIVFGPSFEVRGTPAGFLLAILGVAVIMTTVFVYSTALLYCIELLPYSARAHGLCVAQFTSWAVSATLLCLTQRVPSVSPFILFIGLASVSLLGTIFYLFSKETRDQSFTEGIPFDKNSSFGEKTKVYPIDISTNQNIEISHRLPFVKSTGRRSSRNHQCNSESFKRQVSIQAPESLSTAPLHTAETHLTEMHPRDTTMDESLRRINSKTTSAWLESLNLRLPWSDFVDTSWRYIQQVC